MGHLLRSVSVEGGRGCTFGRFEDLISSRMIGIDQNREFRVSEQREAGVLNGASRTKQAPDEPVE